MNAVPIRAAATLSHQDTLLLPSWVQSFSIKSIRMSPPVIAYAGYAVATATAYLRIYNDRHWINDVIAGACIGILSTKLSYKLYPLIFHKSDCQRSSNVAALPYYDGRNLGLCMSVTF